MRRSDAVLLERILPLHHAETAVTVAAERAFLTRLEGGCQVPIGAYATLHAGRVELSGLIATADGKTVLRETRSSARSGAENLGRELAEALLARGGRAILEAVYQGPLS